MTIGGLILTRFQEMMEKNKMSLIVSLPENDLSLGRAAIEAGADGLKFHINVEHRASGNIFYGLNEYKSMFATLRDECNGPLGIVLGDSPEKISFDEVRELEDIGFDYFSLYSKDIPLELLKTKLAKTFAIADGFHIDLLDALDNTIMDGFEISIVKKEDYGLPLTFQDYLAYKSIIDKVAIPTIIPSQKKLIPSDIPYLHDIGVDAVMLGAVVIGKSVKDISKSVKEFRKAIDELQSSQLS